LLFCYSAAAVAALSVYCLVYATITTIIILLLSYKAKRPYCTEHCYYCTILLYQNTATVIIQNISQYYYYYTTIIQNISEYCCCYHQNTATIIILLLYCITVSLGELKAQCFIRNEFRIPIANFYSSIITVLQ